MAKEPTYIERVAAIAHETNAAESFSQAMIEEWMRVGTEPILRADVVMAGIHSVMVQTVKGLSVPGRVSPTLSYPEPGSGKVKLARFPRAVIVQHTIGSSSLRFTAAEEMNDTASTFDWMPPARVDPRHIGEIMTEYLCRRTDDISLIAAIR